MKRTRCVPRDIRPSVKPLVHLAQLYHCFPRVIVPPISYNYKLQELTSFIRILRYAKYHTVVLLQESRVTRIAGSRKKIIICWIRFHTRMPN